MNADVPMHLLQPPSQAEMPEAREHVAAATDRLELRVLSGRHAGARALLIEDSYVVGHHDECDLQLGDPGVQARHARLQRRVDGEAGEAAWQMHWLDENGEDRNPEGVALEIGRALPFGSVVLMVDDPDADWPTLEALVLAPAAVPPPLQLPVPVEPLPPRAARVLPPRRSASVTRRVLTVFVTATTACMSTAAFVTWPLGSSSGDRGRSAATLGLAASAPAAASAPVPGPPAAMRRAIEAALGPLSLGPRVQVVAAGERWVVRAVMLTDKEIEDLSIATASLQPRPPFHHTGEDDLVEGVRERLSALADAAAGGISVTADAGGRLRVRGAVARREDADRITRGLALAFPQVPGWDMQLDVDEDRAARLLERLIAQGWPVTGVWREGVMELDVRLAAQDVARWESALLAAKGEHDVPFRARVVQELDRDTGKGDAPAAATRSSPGGNATAVAPLSGLPFDVRSVVGGDMAFVLLPGGERLAQGAVHQGWRLAGITANQIVFENGTQRAVLPR